MQAVTLTEVADELYGLPPGEFIAARDERARRAKSAGRREDAAAIRKLARPTTSAWLVNQLSRGGSERLSRLFEVGTALQEAQRTLAGDRLRELSGQRRQAVSDLLPVAAGIAAEAGQVASPAVLEEVRATLEAALADQDAREAVRSGRLTKALAYAGLGEVDLTAAFAQVPPAPGGRAAGRGASKASAGQAAPPSAAPAAEALAAAEAAAASAADALASAERDLTAADEQRQFQRRRITRLERELAQAKDEDGRLARDERDARRRRDQAQRELAAAKRRLDQARRTAQPPGLGRKQPG